MSTYLVEAQHHAEKIEHYYKHAGTAGYTQARYHAGALSDLLKRAHDSEHGKDDVLVIRAIIEKTRPLMEEMQKRAKEG